MKKFGFLIIIILSSILSNPLGAQEVSHSEENNGENHRHTIGLFISHSVIGQAVEDGKRKTITVPSWALNYTYSFAEKWGAGLHTDIILETFTIESDDGAQEIERERPIATVVVGTYEIVDGFGLEIGGGVEWEKSKNFGLLRFGAEYGWHIPGVHMEAVAFVDYDILFGGYDTFNVGLGLAKRF